MIWPFRPRPPRLRSLTAADAQACARLHATGFARGWSAAEFESLFASPGVSGTAAVGSGGDLVGFALLRFVLDEAEVLTVIVRADRRRRGLGRDLMLDQLGRAGARGVRSVLLEVDESNASAIALYRALGFRSVGERPSYYPTADGRRSGALIMRVDL